MHEKRDFSTPQLYFLLLKGTTGLSSISSNLDHFLQLQVNKTKADMSMSTDAGRI